MSNQSEKSNSDAGTPAQENSPFICLHFAKKLRGLHPAERAALMAICDHAGKFTSVCTASLETMSDETGHAVRKLRYGLHGRGEHFDGIVALGLVKADGGEKGGRKKTTCWRPQIKGFLDLLSDDDADALRKRLHIEEQKAAQNDEKAAQQEDKGGTNDVERLHIEEQKAAYTPTSSKSLALKNNSEAELPEAPAWIGWAADEFAKRETSRSGKELRLSETAITKLEAITAGRTVGVFRRAFTGWLHRADGFEDDNPAETLLEELPWFLQDAEKHDVLYDD